MIKRQLTQSLAGDVSDEQERYRSGVPEIVVLFDKQLQRFHDWLLGKGDEAHVSLALRWIAEFEAFAEEDEQTLIELKEMMRARNDTEAAVVLKFIALMEETEAPWPMLYRLNIWLEAKGNDPTAVLARWWLSEFEEAEGMERQQEQSSKTYH
jgi:hypothetical protein